MKIQNYRLYYSARIYNGIKLVTNVPNRWYGNTILTTVLSLALMSL